MVAHFKKVCQSCGIIITQCRCPSKDKVIIYDLCDKCKNSKGENEMTESTLVQIKKEDLERINELAMEIRYPKVTYASKMDGLYMAKEALQCCFNAALEINRILSECGILEEF